MDLAIAASAGTAVLGVLGTLGAVWLREHRRRRQLREQARRDHVRCLPPGSRIVDLGGYGMVIDIGVPTVSGRGEAIDDPR